MDELSITALIGLVTLTFDLSISKWRHGSAVSWASFLSIFSFLSLFIIDFGSNTRQTTAIKYSALAAPYMQGARDKTIHGLCHFLRAAERPRMRWSCVIWLSPQSEMTIIQIFPPTVIACLARSYPIHKIYLGTNLTVTSSFGDPNFVRVQKGRRVRIFLSPLYNTPPSEFHPKFCKDR